MPFVFKWGTNSETTLLVDSGLDMHPTSYSLIILLANGKPSGVKMKSVVYDYKDNKNTPKILDLKEFRLLYSKAGNFETGLYYCGNRRVSSLFNTAKNSSLNVEEVGTNSIDPENCFSFRIRTGGLLFCTSTGTSYDNTCTFVPTYSVGVRCVNEEDELQDYLLDSTEDPESGGGTIVIDSLVKVLADTSILNNPSIKCIIDSINNGVLSKLFTDLFPWGTRINIKLGELNYSTKGKTDFDPGTDIYTITINRADALSPNYNKLFIAKTIIHEYFHVVLSKQCINITGTNDLLWISTHLHSINDATTNELLQYFYQLNVQNGYWNPIGHLWMANHFEYFSNLLQQYVTQYYPTIASGNLYGMKPYYAMMGFQLDADCIDYELMVRGIVSEEDMQLFFEHLKSTICPE